MLRPPSAFDAPSATPPATPTELTFDCPVLPLPPRFPAAETIGQAFCALAGALGRVDAVATAAAMHAQRTARPISRGIRRSTIPTTIKANDAGRIQSQVPVLQFCDEFLTGCVGSAIALTYNQM